MHALVRLLTAAVLVTGIAACDGTTPPLRPEQAAAASELQQTVQAGDTVPSNPAVRVLTASGRAVPGVTVTFTVSPSGGTLTGASQLTNAEGVARLTAWVLGPAVGEHAVTASVSGMSGHGVTFYATTVAGPPALLTLGAEAPAYAIRGAPLTPAPVVQVADRFGNATAAELRVTATTAVAGARLDNAEATTDSAGRATFTELSIDGAPGEYSIGFAAAGLPSVSLPSPVYLFADAQGACGPPRMLPLQLGETVHSTLHSAAGLACLEFDLARNGGQQFLLLLENMPATGQYGAALFGGSPAASVFDYALVSTPRTPTGVVVATTPAQRVPAPRTRPEHATQVWDFGAGPIYEIEPVTPLVPRSPLLRTPAGRIDMAAVSAGPAIGDTVEVWMEPIDRLGMPAGYQQAVIRHVSDLLVIAEDVRLGTTLRRQGGGFNTPLDPDTMAAIARQYAQYARVQGDLLFDGGHNAAIEAAGGRVLAVHSLMPADNIWGYTYSASDYFVWDYWVGTDGRTAGLNQRVERNVDNLFMHEVAHMRHLGLLQRHNVSTALRGNRWLVEGFARFTERLPIAARLLGTQEPARTGNITLPMNPAFGTAYFRDDVPTFLHASSSMFGGYSASSFVFDYLADQVALQGGDWRAAIREFLLAAGSRGTLDGAVNRWAGITFAELFTRSRLALYLDDIGTPGLPPWTQYHQYDLRASRPAGPLATSDPRNAWTALLPGIAQQVNASIGPGAAWGYVIDGTRATGSAVISVTGPTTANAVVSVTRIH